MRGAGREGPGGADKVGPGTCYLPVLQSSAAILLRKRKFSDTSLIVSWCTESLGCIQTMARGARRPRSPFDSHRLQLRSLQAYSRYAVRDIDTGEERSYSGRELMNQGLPLTAASVPQALLLTYKTIH